MLNSGLFYGKGLMLMENPTLDFLLYLIRKCIRQCQVDPDNTTISEFMRIIVDTETPLGV
jgi:hypothetical protein